MKQLETKPKNAKEAIEAGWITAKELYEGAGVCRDTFNEFLSDVRNAASQKPNSGCASTVVTNWSIQLGSAHKAYYHPKVERAFQLWLMRNQVNQGVQVAIKDSLRTVSDIDGFKYSKEDICDLCKVSESTFKNFLAGQPVDQRNFISVGSSHKKLYNETALKAFQLWLMRNQTEQGRTSQVVKEATKNNLEFGVLAKVALTDKVAWEQFKALGDAKIEADQKLQLQQQQNQQLQLENLSMRTTLQYDKVKNWYRWSDLKRDWKPNCERLKKGNYISIFDEAGLEYGKDYEEITFNGCEFPTCMVSPTAIPTLMNYLHITIS